MRRRRRTDEGWNCPHCGERIDRGVARCPACQRHLRAEAVGQARGVRATLCALHVDGAIEHPGTEVPWEYTVLVGLYDARGELMSRHVVDIDALYPGEGRTFVLRVEVGVPETPARRRG